jgi:K+-sensing histidine kinase KdpD
MTRAVPSRSSALAGGVVAGWLAAASLVVWVLEDGAGVPNASSAYLLAVVGTAVSAGTWAAVIASAGAFLLYDFLFTRPIHTLAVTDRRNG